MKKLSLLLVLALLTLTGCTLKPQPQPWLQDTWTTDGIGAIMPYSGELTI